MVDEEEGEMDCISQLRVSRSGREMRALTKYNN
jgi:hypothetical protein